MKELYKLPITELKRKHTDFIIGRATRNWKRKEIPNEEIADKVDTLTTKLDGASKPEFLAILINYQKLEV